MLLLVASARPTTDNTATAACRLHSLLEQYSIGYISIFFINFCSKSDHFEFPNRQDVGSMKILSVQKLIKHLMSFQTLHSVLPQNITPPTDLPTTHHLPWSRLNHKLPSIHTTQQSQDRNLSPTLPTHFIEKNNTC